MDYKQLLGKHRPSILQHDAIILINFLLVFLQLLEIKYRLVSLAHQVSQAVLFHTGVEEQLELVILQHIVAKPGPLLLEGLRRWEDGVQAYLQGVLDHLWDHFHEHGAIQLQAGVRVYLDQPGMELGVDHEIEPEDLEVVPFAIGVQHQSRCLHGVIGYVLHLWVNGLEEAQLSMVFNLQIILELSIGKLIAPLILSVVGQLFLHCIVGQVHRTEPIGNGVLIGSSPNVTELTPVAFHMAIDTGDEHVMPDIKFPPVVEKRLLDILLNNVSAIASIIQFHFVLQYSLDFLKGMADRDPIASVGQFSRLYDPDIPIALMVRFVLFLLAVEVFQEHEVFGVVQACLYVEGQRQVGKYVLVAAFIVGLHGCEQGFFVAQHIITRQMVVDLCFIALYTAGCLPEHFVPLIEARSQLLFYFFMLIEILNPCFSQFLIHHFDISTINGSLHCNDTLTTLETGRRFTIGLATKDTINFDLCPYEIGFLDLLGEGPPGLSSLQQCLYQIGVVAPPDVRFVLLWH